MATTNKTEAFEVLTRRPDGHETVHRVRATSQAAAEKAADERLANARPGGDVIETVKFSDGGLGSTGAA